MNSNGTLRKVFIRIIDGLPRARWTPPAESAKRDQSGCVGGPHVLGIMTGQPLEILNNDPVNHNVHAEAQVNAARRNESRSRRARSTSSSDSSRKKCDVSGDVQRSIREDAQLPYIGIVSAHPFFAVTGDDGSFTLKGVPPGTYTIEAVHEKYGRKEGRLTLAPNGDAKLDFSYGS